MEVQFEYQETEPQEELIPAPASFKHHCRVCKRGFGCGRALGGHMRAHGLVAGDQEVDVEAEDDVPGRRMYALRANSKRLKACQACDNCGMEFSSWKGFLDHHGKCSSGGDNDNDGNQEGDDNDDDSVLSSPRCHDVEIDQDGGRGGAGGWSKLGKRSTRSRSVAKPADSGSRSEEEVLANWLLMLSSSSSSATAADQGLKVEPVAEADRGEEDRIESKDGDEKETTAPKAAFQCKGCKKVFASHQALGGHRASHKTVKGCFAARLDQDGGDGIPPSPRNEEYDEKAKPSDTVPPTPKRKHKMHECTICRRTFSSGQALGGHKRCHWITSVGMLDHTTTSPPLSKIINPSHLQDPFFLQPHSDGIPMVVNGSSVPIDLNLPATEAESSPQIQYYNGIISHKDVGDDGGQVEVEKRMKLAKLRDMRAAMENVGREAAPWLQMGIGSTATNVVVGADI